MVHEKHTIQTRIEAQGKVEVWIDEQIAKNDGDLIPCSLLFLAICSSILHASASSFHCRPPSKRREKERSDALFLSFNMLCTCKKLLLLTKIFSYVTSIKNWGVWTFECFGYSIFNICTQFENEFFETLDIQGDSNNLKHWVCDASCQKWLIFCIYTRHRRLAMSMCIGSVHRHDKTNDQHLQVRAW